MVNARPSEMVEFEGRRYQPSDLPKTAAPGQEPPEVDVDVKAAAAPRNKARSASNKAKG